MFESPRRVIADYISPRARLRRLAGQAGTSRPDDQLPADQPWIEEGGESPAGPGRLVRLYQPGGAVNRRRWVVVVVAATILLALGIGIAVASGGPVPEPVPALPRATDSGRAPVPVATSAPGIVVSVRGRVVHPGLVTLRQGARVADAIKACGGLRHGADPGALNLARKLSDGEQIYVAVPTPVGADPSGSTTLGSGAAPAKVDLNTATAAQLDTLPGVGAVTAQRIVQWREQHGRFSSVDQLQQVSGIGDAKFATLKDLVVAS